MNSIVRNIPSVSTIISDNRIEELAKEISSDNVKYLVSKHLNYLRSKENLSLDEAQNEAIVQEVLNLAKSEWPEWPIPVINGTGVILHTNLGRSPLSESSIEASIKAAQGYSDLELDLKTGKRGSRQKSIINVLNQITKSEDALVVNNTASALLLTLTSLSKGGEVIISRSQAIEIGGGFRIPDVLMQSGAKLIEVGTTNRTYVKDYVNAITENTKAILVMHASNYKVLGFTHEPEINELSEIAQRHQIPLIHDVGSGCIVDPTKFGLSPEPRPQDSIKDGSDICMFSGDKLLGGPQAGIIIGKSYYISQISKHPLARAIRIDKINLSALHATLLHYIKDEVEENIPIWKMISTTQKSLLDRAKKIKSQINADISITETIATIGGGSLPGENLKSYALKIETNSTNQLGYQLRNAKKPIMSRVENSCVLIDLRTIPSEFDEILIQELDSLVID